MIKIAVFMAGVRFDTQRNILNGIMEEAKKQSVSLTIFTCDVWTMSDVGHMNGEMSILDLPDLSDFDGVIVHSGSFNDAILENEFLPKLREMGIPHVSLSTEVDGAYNIKVDNEESEFDLVEHLITEHKVKKFGVITGPSDNRDSEGRLKGFRRALACYGLKWDELYTYVGNYHPDSGMMAVNYFMKLPEGLPEAIVAFNDEMATGAIFFAQKKGLRVPEDLIVTGFDETVVSRLFHPTITTVRRKDGYIGSVAIEKCLGLIDGTISPMTENVVGEFIPAESCGCVDKRTSILEEAAKTYSNYKFENTTYVELVKSSIADFSNVTEYRDFISVVRKYVNFIEAKSIFLCLKSEESSEYSYIVAARHDGKFIQQKNEYFETKRLLPEEFWLQNPEDFDIVIPMHNGEKKYGHIVIRNSRAIADNDIFGIFISAINIGLERLDTLGVIKFGE